MFKDGKDSCIDSNHLKSGSSGTVTYDKKDPGKYVSKFYFSNVPIGPTFTFEVLVPDSLPETSTTNPPTAPRENLELENCELQERIGEGEFAEVYTANFHNTVVAVKLFKNKFKRDIHRLVETEVNKLAQLRHPNVIQYMGTIVFQNRPGIVMEKMKMSLDDVLVENNEISIQTKKKIFIDIAQALCFIHSLPNSYHGDLKPANVLLNGEITNASTIVVKLCDFSQARIRFAVTSSISSATTIYTPRYAAPELSLGLSKTSAIDIFSFGILIWESLTGETPFLNEENVCKAICGGDRPSVKNFDKNVSNLLTAMWQGKPDQRPSISTVLQKMKEIF
uniref:Protein kinase domain-containing protein n=1 Tax=Arcella intermedia TaxID=1963864 RepID=A0A6B2L9E3_9EUKA